MFSIEQISDWESSILLKLKTKRITDDSIKGCFDVHLFDNWKKYLKIMLNLIQNIFY